MLKHAGLPPARGSIGEFPSVVLNFLEENCRDLWDVDFNRVSMVDLVRSDHVRPHLHSAEEAIADGDGVKAMGELALGFAKLVDKHEVIGVPPESLTEYPMRVASEKFWSGSEIEKLRSVVSVLALGLDLRRWARFRRLAPQIVRVSVGELHYVGTDWTGDPPGLADCQYCFGFVIESALKLEAEDV